MRRRLRSLRFLGACAAALVVAVGLPIAFQSTAEAAGPPVTVTVEPNGLLGDGQLVTVTIKTTADYPLVGVEMRICRSGVEYKTRKGPRPDDDALLGGSNCPDKGVSTSADVTISDGTTVFDNAGTERGAVYKYRVGSGTIGWTHALDQSAQTLTCDADHPCKLLVEVRGADDGVWTPFPVELSYKPDDPVAGCGGAAPDVLLSGGSDRMSDAWVSWTLDDCAQEGREGATSRAVFTGEGPSVRSFAEGGLDLAYTAGGYGDEMGLLSELPEGEEPRQAIAVPIGINAVVLGVFGGHRNETGVKVPYEDLKLTLPELAGLLSGGIRGIEPHYQDVFARNPELDGNFFESGNRAGFAVAAPAEAEAISWIATEHLLTTAPEAWKVPQESQFGEDAGRARGADASLALADPTYALSLTLLSGRPPLAKAVAQVLQSTGTVGGAWVLTDLETATALGMSMVKLANVDGDFVGPTTEAVKAGVASMQETDNGMLLPDPGATAEVGGVTPYPLAYVEYALVPAEPLVDGDCKVRTGSNALLTSWLQYLTGRGQEHLPAGMLPLTPELKQRAEQQIELVGQSPITGACAGTVVPSTTTTTTAPTTVTTAPSNGSLTTPTTVRSPRSSGGRTSNTVANVALAPTQDVSTDDTVEIANVPDFAGRNAPGWAGTFVALVGLVGLSGLAAVAAGRRRPPEGSP
jgi:hypothetical protein